jgi:hypothetical protein
MPSLDDRRESILTHRLAEREHQVLVPSHLPVCGRRLIECDGLDRDRSRWESICVHQGLAGCGHDLSDDRFVEQTSRPCACCSEQSFARSIQLGRTNHRAKGFKTSLVQHYSKMKSRRTGNKTASKELRQIVERRTLGLALEVRIMPADRFRAVADDGHRNSRRDSGVLE